MPSGRPASMISHHLPDEHLLHYAAGALSPGAMLVAAGHLNYCPTCRAAVREAEALGGAMLEAEAAGAMPAGLPAVLPDPARLAPSALTPSKDTDVPLPLRPYIGDRLAGARWRWLWFGSKTLHIARPKGGGRTFLLRVEPGAGLPVHTHSSDEMTLVLQGSFTDETGHYRVGDVAMADPSITHRQIADPGEVCICLTSYDAPLKFSSFLAKLGGVFLLR